MFSARKKGMNIKQHRKNPHLKWYLC